MSDLRSLTVEALMLRVIYERLSEEHSLHTDGEVMRRLKREATMTGFCELHLDCKSTAVCASVCKTILGQAKESESR
jgi:hypothetical protein